MKHRVLHHPRFDAPAVIHPQVHAENRRPQADAVAGHDGVAEIVHLHNDDGFGRRAALAGVINGVDRVVEAERVGALPGGADVEEADELKIAPERAHDRFFGKIFKNGHPQLSIEQGIRAAIADVLFEPAHIGGQGLVGKVFVLRRRNIVVKGGEKPVVDPAQVV